MYKWSNHFGSSFGFVIFAFTAVVGASCASGSPDPTVSAVEDFGSPLPVREDAGVVPLPDAMPDAALFVPPRIVWSGLNSSMQIIQELTDPMVCENGWTRLWAERAEEGEGGELLLPIQPAYVNPENNAFAAVSDFGEALSETYATLGVEIPKTRIALSWPCFMTSLDLRSAFVIAISQVQDAGYQVEISLGQWSSYPAYLHDSPDFGVLGGWAHPEATALFLEYVDAVLLALGSELPEGTVVYLGIEPMAELFDGYLNSERKYPPGGGSAGRSLARAMRNQREAFLSAGVRIRKAGFVPALGLNIRPLVSGAENDGAELLEYLHNWWLGDALVKGCVDDDFDQVCEDTVSPAVDALNITFYGTMGAGLEDAVEFGLPGEPSSPLARRAWSPTSFNPDAEQFRAALTATRERYLVQITEGVLTLAVSEIGLSGTVTQQTNWLDEYLAVMDELGITQAGLHAIFNHAEFTNGDFTFNLVSRCGPCETTEWGSAFLGALRTHRLRENE